MDDVRSTATRPYTFRQRSKSHWNDRVVRIVAVEEFDLRAEDMIEQQVALHHRIGVAAQQ